MNPVFIFLVILSAILVWMLCSGLFKYIGAFFNEMIGDIKNEIKTEEEKNDEEE